MRARLVLVALALTAPGAAFAGPALPAAVAAAPSADGTTASSTTAGATATATAAAPARTATVTAAPTSSTASVASGPDLRRHPYRGPGVGLPVMVLTIAAGPRAQLALARPFDLPEGHGFEVVVDLGVWAKDTGFIEGLQFYVGPLGGRHFQAPTGETWQATSMIGAALYAHVALTDNLLDSTDHYLAPVFGGRFAVYGSYGEWTGSPCATQLRDPACQRSLLAADTTRTTFTPLVTGGLVAGWGPVRATLLATVGAELASTSLTWTGAATEAARAAFTEVVETNRPSGASLVAGLELTIGYDLGGSPKMPRAGRDP